ncbi:hypothetical protein HDU76_007638 [Blyttiomyces sp. JEL0837]|nr:hypothetical protein HDU76_007638 [Blyttiomyces sp. JEL0837]
MDPTNSTTTGTITINFATFSGWTSSWAWAFTPIFGLYILAFTFLLLKYSRPKVTRTSFIICLVWAVLRTIGVLLRGVAASGDNGTNLALFITAQIILSCGLLPLYNLNLKHIATSVNTITKFDSTFHAGIYTRYQRFLNSLLTIAISLLITAASWIATSQSSPPYTVSDIPFTLRKVGVIILLLLAVLPLVACRFVVGWVQQYQGNGGSMVAGLSVERFRFTQIVLILQAFVLTVRTSYSVATAFQNSYKDETAFYLLSFIPEIIFMGFFVVYPTLMEEFESPETVNVNKTSSDSEA